MASQEFIDPTIFIRCRANGSNLRSGISRDTGTNQQEERKKKGSTSTLKSG